MEEVPRKDDLREDVPKAETLVEKRSPEERSLKQNSLENGNQEKRAQKEGSWFPLPAQRSIMEKRSLEKGILVLGCLREEIPRIPSKKDP